MKKGSFPGTLSIVAALSFLVLLGSAQAQLTILEVGPHGTYTKIQDAIDVVVSGVDTEIRVEGASTYVENLVIPFSFNAGTLTLLGGWDMTFSDRIFLPQDTVIDGNQAGRVLDMFLVEGSLVVDGFTITNGLAASSGGGVRIDPSGDSHATLDHVRIIGNTVTSAGSASGGGLGVELYANQRVEVLNCRIKDNLATSTGGGGGFGGGVSLRVIGDSSFLIQGCEIDQNTVQSSGQVQGAGVKAYLQDNAQGELLDNSIVDNIADGTDVWSIGAQLDTRDFSFLNVERTAFGVNMALGGDSGAQVRTNSGASSSLRMSDSIVGLGDYDGLLVEADNSSTVNLVNLTVVDNAEDGIEMNQFGMATMTLYNTISFGNLVDLRTSGTVDTGSNLIGIDPLFVNPATIDFRLGLGSPAENAGDNTPPGNLGAFDFARDPRVKDVTVDIGAYEGISEVFSDGFESGDTSPWSSTLP